MADPIVTPPADVTPPWHAGLDAELLGHAQTKGWNLTDAKAAFADAAKAYRGAEQHVGAPPEQILRLPKDPNDAAWKDVWGRLGAPAEATGYKFEGVEFDTPELTAKFIDRARALAAELHVPAPMAERMVQDFHKFVGELGEAEEAARLNAVDTAKAKLQSNWGANFEANLFVAKQAAQALGVNAEEVAALETVVGYDRVMELFRSIGQKIGEDKFVLAPNGGSKTMTREQALARRAELMGDGRPGSGDAAWQKRYLEGGTGSAEFKELQALFTMIG